MGSTHFLPSVSNPQVAAKMLLTGETISGSTALKHGLVLETATDGTATLSRALEIAREIAAAAPIAVRSCVRSLRLAQDEGLERALWREADSQTACAR
jgi:enoyl-CoA hydratase/carnithine racemase